jgi:dTDP-4-dehydrorhamnose 3,5-epimerase-like enzyme
MPTEKRIIQTPIQGVTIELQPTFGQFDGSVMHMLPGGIQNPEGFGEQLLDIYAFTAHGQDQARGGHYHHTLNELFFTMSGTALWILSDMRPTSPTHRTTHTLILSINKPNNTFGFPSYSLEDGAFPRLRIPAGVYHAIFPLTEERVTCVALGSTPYDAQDYAYPTHEEIPGMQDILKKMALKKESEK